MKRELCLLAMTLSLVGCQTDPNGPFSKENIGTVLGGVGGAVLGSQIGGGSGRIVAAVIGAGAGAFIGNQLGKTLDEADRKQIAQADNQALSAPPGQAISWRNPDGGASGSSSASAPTKEVVAKAPDGTIRTVSKTPKLSLVSGRYTVHGTSNVNIRAEPTTKSNAVGTLRSGETVDAVGKVVGSDWMLVARSGETLGYVSGALISPAATATQIAGIQQQPQRQENASAQTVVPPPPFKLVEAPVIEKPVSVATVSSQPDVAPGGAAEETTCRVVTRAVTKNGESAQEQVKYCKTAEGWQRVEA